MTEATDNFKTIKSASNLPAARLKPTGSPKKTARSPLTAKRIRPPPIMRLSPASTIITPTQSGEMSRTIETSCRFSPSRNFIRASNRSRQPRMSPFLCSSCIPTSAPFRSKQRKCSRRYREKKRSPRKAAAATSITTTIPRKWTMPSVKLQNFFLHKRRLPENDRKIRIPSSSMHLARNQTIRGAASIRVLPP